MNKLERYIYNFLKSNPVIKNKVVDLYQRATIVFPVKTVDSEYDIVVREGYFFGFHDKCPWSAENGMLLAHKYNDLPLSMPGPGDSIEVGYFSGPDSTDYKTVGRTCSWNWQMGAMLQWVGESSMILFNDFDGEKNIARIVTHEGDPVTNLPLPAAAVSPDGKKALNLSFERMRVGAPEYTYACGKEEEENIPIPEHNGLSIIDIDTSRVERLFSIKEIAQIEPDDSMVDSYHFLSHCRFSPSGKRFLFYHRWLRPNRLLRTRMITCDADGRDLYFFRTSGMVSHVCWKDENHILAYASTESKGDGYYIFKDRENEVSMVAGEMLSSDGHPQFARDGKSFLTDTYPDRFRRQCLIIFDMVSGSRRDVAKLRIPLRFRYGVRCDFHPRWNRDSTGICFDSAHTGIRSLCTIRL